MSTDLRPTSPHLSIYRPQITSVMSIMHRMTGVALGAGSAVIVAWLYIAAYDPAKYAPLQEFLSSFAGCALMIGWTLAFYYHLCNGIRHLFWDMGMGFSIAQVTRSGVIVLAAALLLTGLTWCPYLMPS